MALFLTYFSYFSLRPTLLGFVNKVCNLKFYIFQFPSFRNFFTQYGINMITLQHQDIELLLQQQLPHKLLLVSMKQIMVTQQLPSTSQVIIIGLLNYTRNICFWFEKLKNSLGFLINKYLHVCSFIYFTTLSNLLLINLSVLRPSLSIQSIN